MDNVVDFDQVWDLDSVWPVLHFQRKDYAIDKLHKLCTLNMFTKVRMQRNNDYFTPNYYPFMSVAVDAAKSTSFA
jgi:hypothetical protein